MNTRRVLLRVDEIRAQPNGRTETTSRKILEMLRAFLREHPNAQSVRDMIEALEREIASPPAKQGSSGRHRRITFGDFATRWVADRRRNGARTPLEGALVRQRLEPAFGKRALNEITAADVKKWIESRRDSKTLPAEKDLLRSIFMAAVSAGFLKSVPGDEHLR
jgi:hypothetical protein